MKDAQTFTSYASCQSRTQLIYLDWDTAWRLVDLSRAARSVNILECFLVEFSDVVGLRTSRIKNRGSKKATSELF